MVFLRTVRKELLRFLASYPCMMVSLLLRGVSAPHRLYGVKSFHLTTELLHPVNNEGSHRHLSAVGPQRRGQKLPVPLGECFTASGAAWFDRGLTGNREWRGAPSRPLHGKKVGDHDGIG